MCERERGMERERQREGVRERERVHRSTGAFSIRRRERVVAKGLYYKRGHSLKGLCKKI